MKMISSLSEQLKDDSAGVEPLRNYFIQLKHGGKYYETEQSQFVYDAYCANSVRAYGRQLLLVSCRIYEKYMMKLYTDES